MIKRDPKYYLTGYPKVGKSYADAPFYQRALVFDEVEGDFNTCLVDEFNFFMKKEGFFEKEGLMPYSKLKQKLPAKILVVNASHDDLPTSHETARVFQDKLPQVKIKVVNTKEEILDEIGDNPHGVLLVSQCVDKKVYDANFAEKLEKKGVVIVPGVVTAPGGVFSDKDSTYKLLSDNGQDWSEVAVYKKVKVESRSYNVLADSILKAVDSLQEQTKKNKFFVKPHEGGGGLGGFRINKTEEGYVIPDLSKVSGETSEIHPDFIDFDLSHKGKLVELLWIYCLFSSDENMSKNYIKVKLPLLEIEDEEEALGVLMKYLLNSSEKRREKLRDMALSREEAVKCIADAIKAFESKFKRKYIPLVNEHLDFGLWGLRAHYRLTEEGPMLETMYHRIFQLAFTEEGVGYVGADNISNKQTGDLEIERLGPINQIMFDSIGGEKALFKTLLKGSRALVMLNNLVSSRERGKLPLRLQVDLAVPSKRIGEGNADTARGLCLASRWPEFVRNNQEWLKDSLNYYSWKKRNIKLKEVVPEKKEEKKKKVIKKKPIAKKPAKKAPAKKAPVKKAPAKKAPAKKAPVKKVVQKKEKAKANIVKPKIAGIKKVIKKKITIKENPKKISAKKKK